MVSVVFQQKIIDGVGITPLGLLFFSHPYLCAKGFAVYNRKID